ncbi:MAG: chemotaxis protein CheA, partial [Bdellovibrionales bacterium]|nr:chemotaxis protein CheA [Bdellovibrionales bacterium]
NLKGSSKAVGFDQMGAFTHEFESLMLKLKNGEMQVLPPTINLMLRCNDFIRHMVDSLKENLDAQFEFQGLIDEIEQAKQGHFADSAELSVEEEQFNEQEIIEQETISEIPDAEAFTFVEETQTQVSNPVEIQNEVSQQDEAALISDLVPENTSKRADSDKDFQAELDNVLSEVKKITDNLAPVVSMSSPLELEIPASVSTIEKTKLPEVEPEKAPAPVSTPVLSNESSSKPVVAASNSGSNSNKPSSSVPVDESIRVSLSRLEKLQNYVGEMVILQSVLREQLNDSTSLVIKKTAHQLGKVVKEIQDISMNIRMVPVKPTFQKMQRIVRDTAQSLKKDVLLKLSGEDTELDKTVLEKINDPLVHLIRNSVDHGIENAEQRTSIGKKVQGEVQLNAYHQSGKLVIEVKDDGGGLDAEKLKSIAIKKGIIKSTQVLSESEAWNLIFAPGFSTKEQVTDVSGRGVGMDVVKTNIQELSGEIQIHSERNVGTTFKIILPLTLAIIDGMVVQAAQGRYVIPLSHVHESIKPEANQIQFNTGLGEVLLLRGENLPLHRLNNLLGKKSVGTTDDIIAIVIRTGKEPFALLVDDIIGQYQVVIKQLGPELQNLKGFSGSTILGDGRPSLIIEPLDLVKARGKIINKPQEIGRAA